MVEQQQHMRALGIIKDKVRPGGRDINKHECGARGLSILKDKVVVEQQQQHMRDKHGALSILKGKVGAGGRGLKKEDYGARGMGIKKED